MLGDEQMKMFYVTVLIWGSMAGITLARDKPCQPRRHARIPAIKRLDYYKARKKLFAAGWKPLRTKSSTSPDISEGNGPLFWGRGYTEIEACSGTGMGYCSFLFKDVYGNRLRVTTEGEERPSENLHAGVVSYRFVCD
jgi:hypothetical protein